MESIRDSMDKMEGKTGNFETVNLNNKKLLNTLEKIVKQLDLSYTHQQALTEADFRWGAVSWLLMAVFKQEFAPIKNSTIVPGPNESE